MLSNKHNCMLTHRNDTNTLSYDRPAQCYCWLSSPDDSRSFSGFDIIADDCMCIWSVRCNLLEDHGLFCCRLSLNFSNPWFPVSFLDTMSSNDAMDTNSHCGPVAVLVSLEKWAVLMGSAINCSLISAHSSISARFLIPLRLISVCA